MLSGSYRLLLRVTRRRRLLATVLSGAGLLVLLALLERGSRGWEQFKIAPGGYNLETDQISPDDAREVAIDSVGRPVVVDRRARRIVARCPAGPSLATSVHFSPDGARFVSTSIDGVARVWRLTKQAECQLVMTIPGSVPLYDANYSPSGQFVVVVGEHAVARIFNANTGSEERRIATPDQALVAVSYSPTLPRLLTLAGDGALNVWSTTDGSSVLRVKPKGRAEFAQFAADGRRIVVGLRDGSALGFRPRPVFDAALLSRWEFWLALLAAVPPLGHLLHWLRSRPRGFSTVASMEG